MSSFTAPYRVLILPRWLVAVLNQLRACAVSVAEPKRYLKEEKEMSEREGEKEKGSGANTSIYLSISLSARERGS